jgi:hypothetical protein
MSSVMSPASADEALEMLTAAMGYLAAADATAMTTAEQARCLRVLERANSVGTVARTSFLGAFGSSQGHSADADYSPRAWLIHKTGVTKGAAVAYTAWVRRASMQDGNLAATSSVAVRCGPASSHLRRNDEPHEIRWPGLAKTASSSDEPSVRLNSPGTG